MTLQGLPEKEKSEATPLEQGRERQSGGTAKNM